MHISNGDSGEGTSNLVSSTPNFGEPVSPLPWIDDGEYLLEACTQRVEVQY